MSNCNDSSVKSWFTNRGLPWSDDISAILNGQGVQCVNDLKFLEQAVFTGLFEHEKPVIKAKAKQAWEEVGTQPISIVPAQPAIIDVESQYYPQTGSQATTVFANPSISPLAIASICVFAIGFILGIVCIAKLNTANSCFNCDWDRLVTQAQGTGGSAIVFFAIATPLLFCAGRSYLNQKRQQQPDFKADSAGCCACPQGMAITAWVFFGLDILNSVFLLIASFNSDVPTGLVVSALIGNTFAWSLMLAYSEMARRA
jgi:hypothetical protein